MGNSSKIFMRGSCNAFLQAGRREKRDDAEKESTKLQQKLLTNLIRSQAVKEALGLDKAPKLPSVPKKSSRDAVFELAPLTESSERY